MTGDAITVNYHGDFLSRSGYATAARSYVHALHAAGVRVTVIAARGEHAQIEDPLVRSLVGYQANADFNLIHAIPSFWSRSAHAAPNVVAITVWEADPIPQLWRRVLSQVIDVWVPCEFNVRIFANALGRTPFRSPYALPMRNAAVSRVDDTRLGIRDGDFLFYSIFEWQYRKNPQGMMRAFLNAFPDECDAVLLLKTSARAASEAQRALHELRSRTRSSGRIVLHCEPLDSAQIRMLHERGDCYVSLHRGEGWGYPLFEAAASGKPTVASAQGGPVDFLDPKYHRLVPCAVQFVQEPYYLFRGDMTWGEPDVASATGALRWVYDHRDEARAMAQTAAPLLCDAYSVRCVGEVAKGRLRELLAARAQSGSI